MRFFAFSDLNRVDDERPSIRLDQHRLFCLFLTQLKPKNALRRLPESRHTAAQAAQSDEIVGADGILSPVTRDAECICQATNYVQLGDQIAEPNESYIIRNVGSV